MSTGEAQLDAMIAKIRKIPDLVKRAAPACASAFGAAFKADLSAGHAPGGETWAAKKDGGRPLVNAAEHVDVRAVGTVIVSRLTGARHWFVHNQGAGKTLPKRQIIPSGETPAELNAAIERELRNEWNRMMAGAA